MSVSEWLLVLTGVVTALYFWIKHHYSYWRRQNVPFIEPNKIFGNLKELICMTVNPAAHIASLYNHKNAQDQPIVGIHIFHKPALLLRDLDLIKTIMNKDFNKFSNRYTSCDPHGDPLGHYNLFFLKNPQWKEMRSKITPVFTGGKLKLMFPLVAKIGVDLDDYLCKMPLDSGNCIKEVKEISALFTTDVIASVAYGLEANCLKNPRSEFREQGSEIFKWTTYTTIQFNGIFFLPEFTGLFGWKTFSKKAATFIRETIAFVIRERMKSGDTRNDVIDTLVSLKNTAAAEGVQLDDETLIAVAAGLFTAGFETTASSIAFGLYELSKNQEVQNRLREEIKECLEKNGGNITYDGLQEMEYLNMVVQEILRLYPSLPFLDRECTLPKGEKEYSLEPYSDFNIPHGMPVYVSVFAIHKDPKYFSNPDEFDPERFSAENISNLVPNSYMPFGTGPHNCIAGRLGIIKVKIGLISFLRNHKVNTCEKSHKTLTLDPKAVLLQAKGGLYCKFIRDPLFKKIGSELNQYLCRLTKDTKECVREVKEISALYTTDVTALAAYGIYANSLKNKNSDFRRNGKPIFTWTTLKALEYIVIFFVPHLVKLFRAKVFSPESTKFLRKSISFVMADRAKSRTTRNDLIDILVQLKKTSEDKGEFVDINKLIAQAAVFFTAGFETSSSTIAFGLHELSRKPALQKRLRDEIKKSLMANEGKLTYDSLNAMEYLDMVIQEVLRMYPPQPFLDRRCTLAKGEEEFSLSPQLDYNIPNGMAVYFPVFAIQRDPKYFPNPDEFDPERFSPENKPKITPFSYMPFGVGPHNCIGERLGTLQSKMGLVNFLRSHYVEPCEKSHSKIILDPKGLLLSAQGGIYVKLVEDLLFIEK
ncbi:probable cytochrome P450 6g2 [Eupeodes corollae]|uniref:probable cytochrome P450 6g2 n=1 Tax=Eupeodes corollae TaxID=290404 RepID=UPI00248FCAFA|nr:probable cytochrome P450 6g2 [Eupeodes corollae]